MGWFDEQIRIRRKADEDVMEDSFWRIAGAVMGRHMAEALNDNRRQAEDAIGEILKYYRLRPRTMPGQISDINEILEFQLRPGGIMRRAVHLDKGWQKDAMGPMLARRRDDGSITALIPDGLWGYTFIDWKTGKKSWVRGKEADAFEREAIAFYKPFPLKKMNMRELFKYIYEQISTADILLLILSMLAVTATGMLIPRIHNMLFSDVLKSGSMNMLFGVGLFLIGTTVSSLLFVAVRSLMTARITTKLKLNIEAAGMMRILALPVSFFRNYSSGELSNRAELLNSLADMLVDAVLSTGLTSVFSLVYIGQIFRYAPALVVPALTVTLLTLFVTAASVLMRIRITRQQMLLRSKESGMSYALISGIQKIRLSGAEKRAFARWGNLYAQNAELSYNPPMFLRVTPVITTAISMIGTMVMYYLAIRSRVTPADYYAFSSAYGMVNTAFMALSGLAASIAGIRPVLEMVRPIMETVPEISEDKPVVTRFNGGIELNNITFRYREDMPRCWTT